MTIANYESGRNEPSFDDLINLSHKLSVTPNDLIGFSFMDKDISLDELVGKNPSKKEECFVHEFQKLSEKNQNRILDLIKALQL